MAATRVFIFTGILLVISNHYAIAKPVADVPPGTLQLILQGIVEAANVLNEAADEISEAGGIWTTESRDELMQKLQQIVKTIDSTINDGIHKTFDAETYQPNKDIYTAVKAGIGIYKFDMQSAIAKLAGATTPEYILKIVEEDVKPLLYLPK